MGFNNFIIYLKSRTYLFFFLISILSFIFVLFNIIKLNIILGISNIFFLELLFQIIIIACTLYIVTFLPTYPIFFVIFKEKDFNSLEKLNLTIVSNLSFYILSGYIGYAFGFPITAFFFFIALIVFFISITAYIIINEHINGTYVFLKSQNSSYNKNKIFENSSIKDHFKSIIPSNGFLLFIFLLLICVFNVVRFSYFFGTDPWLHIFIIKSIVKMKFLPLEEYYGSVGLPIFGAVIHFFSGVDFILIPKFFIFYTIPVSALVFYNLLMRIFKNKNLAIFGVFILEFSGLGFAYMMYQFWPSHLVIIQSLTIFLLLYIRLQKFIQLERPTRSIILSDMAFYYVLISTIFISALLTHVLTSIVLLLSFLWIYLIYFVKDYKRGVDFLLLCVLVGVFLIFLNFGLSAEHFFFLNRLDYSSFSTLIIFSAIGVAIVGVLLIWRLKNSILFTTGRFRLTIEGKKYSYYKKFEDKIIIPLAFCIVMVLTVFYLIGNLLLFNLPITTVFMAVEILLIVIFAIWGLLLFQKKPRGKLMVFWAVFFIFFFAAVFFFDALTNNSKYWGRVFFMTPPLIVIGFLAYIHKLIKTNSISNLRSKLFISFIITFSLFTTYFHEFETVQYVSLTRRQVGGAQWYSEHTEDKNVIITEFGFNYMFMYYDYPYGDKDEDLRGRHIHYFVDTKEDNLFDPDEHTDDDDENKLQELKEEKETDVVLTIDDQYYLNEDWETYGYLDEDDMEEYYERKYLNRIYSAKSEDGTENAYYWVI